MAPSRNDPCPCGSGNKYKRCCIGKAEGSSLNRKSLVILLVLGIVAGLAVGFFRGPVDGVIAFFGVTLVAACFRAISNPPPSKGGRENAAGINFGK